MNQALFKQASAKSMPASQTFMVDKPTVLLKAALMSFDRSMQKDNRALLQLPRGGEEPHGQKARSQPVSHASSFERSTRENQARSQPVSHASSFERSTRDNQAHSQPVSHASSFTKENESALLQLPIGGSPQARSQPVSHASSFNLSSSSLGRRIKSKSVSNSFEYHHQRTAESSPILTNAAATYSPDRITRAENELNTHSADNKAAVMTVHKVGTEDTAVVTETSQSKEFQSVYSNYNIVFTYTIGSLDSK